MRVPSVPFVATNLALLLTCGAGAQESTAEQLASNATTFCVRVEESYWAYQPSQIRVKSVSLPFRDDASQLLRFTDLREADPCQVTVRISAEGRAEGRQYRYSRSGTSGTPTNLFTGAEVAGTIVIEVDRRSVAERPFRARKSPSAEAYSPPAITADRAPFLDAYRGGNTQFAPGSYPDALAEIVWATFGEKPLLAVATQPLLSMSQPALNVLLRHKSTNLFDTMIAALRHRDPSVRSRAADAVGKLGDRRALSELSVALGDREQSVRESAARAIQQIEGKQ